ncbi:hypothetical protein E2P65_06540 [Candidatus Bathyarchaeota archaeon]|nr:hypothetical protein E2P65_06540 [Candidatus Bathyarchaeota archaeon]
MNKKILCVFVSLFILVLLTIPVLGAPATKIEGVTLTTAVALIPDDTTIFADHNIRHGDGTAAGTATLTIPEQDSLHFDYYGVWNGTSKWTNPPNPDSDATNIIRSTVVLTCTDEGITGTFEGMSHSKTIGLPPPPFPTSPTSYIEYNMVFHGTGDFQGQTLKLSYAGAPPVDLEGCLIKPK